MPSKIENFRALGGHFQKVDGHCFLSDLLRSVKFSFSQNGFPYYFWDHRLNFEWLSEARKCSQMRGESTNSWGGPPDPPPACALSREAVCPSRPPISQNVPTALSMGEGDGTPFATAANYSQTKRYNLLTS